MLIVGELKERLGSFRGTIAREINRRILDLPETRDHTAPAPRLIALTADIGLQIRATAIPAGVSASGRNTVLCSTCSHNNDRLDLERFHQPQHIYEVCVKGDREGMYWNCDLHVRGSANARSSSSRWAATTRSRPAVATTAIHCRLCFASYRAVSP